MAPGHKKVKNKNSQSAKVTRVSSTSTTHKKNKTTKRKDWKIRQSLFGWDSIIDPQLEYVHPKPDIQDLFMDFDYKYFRSALSKHGVTVEWSRRLKVTAGVCYDNPPVIRLSAPLLQLRPRRDTVETLLHEMIHAYLDVVPRMYEYESHGPKFRRQMKRINRLAGTNLQIDHDFYDEVEVNQYKWMCRKCAQVFFCCYKKPPNERLSWWQDHMTKCRGKFYLVHEPLRMKD